MSTITISENTRERVEVLWKGKTFELFFELDGGLDCIKHNGELMLSTKTACKHFIKNAGLIFNRIYSMVDVECLSRNLVESV